MANDKFYGYLPKITKDSLGVPWGNDPRLENVNPYEFKKGMDWELATMGCPRLREATENERTKATTKILKNLKESDAYYSYKMTYETKYRNHQGRKPSFKTYLKEIDSYKMQEVDKEYKNDKMENIKLKEALTKEIKSVLSEGKYLGLQTIKHLSEDKEDEKDEKKAAKSAESKKELSDEIKELEKQRADFDKERQDGLQKYKESAKEKLDIETYKKINIKYKENIDKIDKDIKATTELITDLKLEEKERRREAASIMMDHNRHLELLEIIKEAGVNLSEGAQGVKIYYEIAKTSYMEGLMAGYSKE